ncbi:MAG: UbiA family prenyltransferase [Candidatus Thermoplasmatota archaeon]|nr:UbiA family prenyltransferase [Candidatus Thermoplasmatota archaeon]
MKDPWDRTRYAPMRIRGLIDLLRPFTLLAPAVGGLSGAFIALLATGSLEPPYIDADLPFLHWPTLPMYRLISGIISLVMLNAASNALNQVYDLPIDIVNKSYRPIPSKVITSKEGVWFAVIMYAFALWRAAFVNRWFVLMVSILVIITILYSVPPVRLKKRLWISNVSIAIPRGMLGFVAAWSIMGDISDTTPWVLGSIMAIFLIGSTTTKDVTDIKGDRMYGIRTLPVQYGKKRAIIYSSPFLIAPFFLMAFYWHIGMLPAAALPLSFLFALWSVVLIVMLIREGDREDRHFENSPAWKQMYLMLMGMQVCFLVMYLI